MQEVVKLLALLGAMAFLIEAVIEVIVASWLKRVVQDSDTRAVVMQLCASGLGVVITLMYGINLLGAVAAAFGVTAALSIAPIIGAVLTGLLIGRGAQWFHDIGVTWLGLDGGLPVLRK